MSRNLVSGALAQARKRYRSEFGCIERVGAEVDRLCELEMIAIVIDVEMAIARGRIAATLAAEKARLETSFAIEKARYGS